MGRAALVARISVMTTVAAFAILVLLPAAAATQDTVPM